MLKNIYTVEHMQDFFEMRKCDDDQGSTTEQTYTNWTPTQSQEWRTSARTTNPYPTSTLVPPEPDYEGFEMMEESSMVNSSYIFDYNSYNIDYAANYASNDYND